ncbi:MAG TPA: c-type cytochrome [Thermoanaerobaculia bacterium]|nr:c-type cytochrome [Thermoanaerobaculia bacterium]
MVNGKAESWRTSAPRRALLAPLALFLAGAALGGCDVLLPHRSEGENLYRAHCADCHGLDGAGNTVQSMGNQYASLIDDVWRTGGDDGSIGNVIREGVFGQMPPFKDKLSDQQVSAIIRYLRVLRHEKPREAAP